VASTVEDYRHAAACAMRAGADGVEIHGANGYLIHQFLSTNANQRADRYGGSVSNRIRFAAEIAEAVADEIGAERTGLQISPGNPFNDNVAYGDDELRRELRDIWPDALLANRAGANLPDRSPTSTPGWPTSSPSAPAHWPTPTSSNASRPGPAQHARPRHLLRRRRARIHRLPDARPARRGLRLITDCHPFTGQNSAMNTGRVAG